MPRKTPEQRLKELEARKSALADQIDKTRAMVKKQERSRDTRRKVVAGAIVLEHAKLNPSFAAELDRLLAQHVTRPQDRELFDLAPLPAANDGQVHEPASAFDAARQGFTHS